VRPIPTITTAAGAQDYTFRFIRFEGDPAATSTMVRLGINDSTQTFVSQQPQDITIDRSLFVGDAVIGQKRGLEMNGSNLRVENSAFYDIFRNGQDAQCMAAFNGTGPIYFLNNYCEGAGEGMLTGGDDPQMETFVLTGAGSTDTVLVYNPATFQSGDSESSQVYGGDLASLVGELVAVDTGTTRDHRTVASVDTTANTITLTSALSAAPASGLEISWGPVFDGVYVRHNEFTLDPAWDVSIPVTKKYPCGEFKQGKNIFYQYNYCHHFTGSDDGIHLPMAVKSVNQSDGSPHMETSDVLVEYNVIQSTRGCFLISSGEHYTGDVRNRPRPVTGITYRDNICYNSNSTYGSSYSFMRIAQTDATSGATDVTMENNGFYGTSKSHAIYFTNANAPLLGTVTIRSNVWASSTNGIFADTGLKGTNALTAKGVDTFTHNVVARVDGTYPTNNLIIDQNLLEAAIQNPTDCNTSATAVPTVCDWDASHAYLTGAHDGGSIGPDFATLTTYRAQAIAGTP
jgi:hypothetical protein